MHPLLAGLSLGLALAALPTTGAGPAGVASPAEAIAPMVVQPRPRPTFLFNDMLAGPLKQRLQACAASRSVSRPSRFSIGHRGAPLHFPEHTRESHEAAAGMGAGIVECDVAFTKGKELVCRHARNDLHTTTDILSTPLASTCIRPFTPARQGADGTLLAPATAECRTSELTLAEFKTLRGKVDGHNPRARTVAEYQAGTARVRAEPYIGPTTGMLMSHRESISLFQRLGVQMTPELKRPAVAMRFEGFSHSDNARKLIDEYRQAGVPPHRVWPQSFDRHVVLQWIATEPEFGRQATCLESATRPDGLPDAHTLAGHRAAGIRIVGAPIVALLEVGSDGSIRPSAYARQARAAGPDLIAWTLERSGRIADGNPGWYYQTLTTAIQREGDVLQVLDVLAREVGVIGVFSDWPATVSFYANCSGLQ